MHFKGVHALVLPIKTCIASVLLFVLKCQSIYTFPPISCQDIPNRCSNKHVQEWVKYSLDHQYTQHQAINTIASMKG